MSKIPIRIPFELQISDKDLSLLEERIKRASKSKSAEARRSMVVPLSASGKPIQPMPEEEPPRRVITVDTVPAAESEEEEVEEQPPPPVTQPVAPTPRVIPGPFGLDPELIAKLDASVPTPRKVDIPQVDLKFLDEPVPVPPYLQRSSMVPMCTPQHMPSYPLAHAQPAPAAQHAPPLVDDSQIADIIHSIASPDLNAAFRAVSLISGTVMSGRGAALAAYESVLLTAIATQLRRVRTSPTPPDTQTTLAAYKCLTGALNTFYDAVDCGGNANEEALSEVLKELLRALGGAAGDAERYVRILNNACVSVLEHSPRTPLLCAIVSLLHESIGVSDPAFPRYQDLLLKCFWKTLKMIATWDVNSIDYDAVLYKIHLFYKAYPNNYWKKNTDISDTPYRTVKTLVHTLVKMKSWAIINHLKQIPDVNESDLLPYLFKVLKQLKQDDKKENVESMNGAPIGVGNVGNVGNVGGVGNMGNVGNVGGVGNVSSNTALHAGRLPRALHEELALILNRISTTEHKREALSQLYDLRERHPEVDIWTFMKGSSFYFRNYVERGLKEVAELRKAATMPMYKHDYKTDNMDINNETDEKSHVVFLERLRALQAKAGLKIDSSPTSQPRTPVGDNRALTDSLGEGNLPRTHSIDPQLELHTAQSFSQRNEADMDALRLKLQQIKSSSKK